MCNTSYEFRVSAYADGQIYKGEWRGAEVSATTGVCS